jgi:hypothetical protein
MDKVVEIGIEIGIGIENKGNAGMFDTDTDPEKKHFRCYQGLS